MSDPTFMRVPLFPRGNCETVELPFGISELDPIAGLEISVFRHMRILGETHLCGSIQLYRPRDGTVTSLPQPHERFHQLPTTL